jgi:predicted DNA-binding transcriptional regulator AlpA
MSASSIPAWELEPVPEFIEFLSPQKTYEVTTLSPRQQDRLEAEGKFPKKIKLGVGKNGRTARAKHEIAAWNRARLAERDTAKT